MSLAPPDIQLRPYREHDAKTITEIYAHYVKTSAVTFDIEAPDQHAITQNFASMQKAGHPLIVAMLGENLVGYAYASTFRPRHAYRFTCEDTIYLAPEMAGRGLGSLLLAELIQQSRDFGFNQMIAIITAGTQNSIAIHHKFGFEILGEFPQLGFKFDCWHGIVHMQRTL